jgi:hypothetical protein
MSVHRVVLVYMLIPFYYHVVFDLTGEYQSRSKRYVNRICFHLHSAYTEQLRLTFTKKYFLLHTEESGLLVWLLFLGSMKFSPADSRPLLGELTFFLICQEIPRIVWNTKFPVPPHSMCGPRSSVGIETGYGLDGPGIESRWGARFFAPVQTGPETHPASCTMGTGSFPGVKRPGRGADHPPPSSAEVKKE